MIIKFLHITYCTIFVLFLFLCSCSPSTEDDKRDTASRQLYTEVKIEKQTCITPITCIDIDVKYPRFMFLSNDQIEKKLNWEIYTLAKKELIGLDPFVVDQQSIASVISGIIANYQESVEANEVELAWDISLEISVLSLQKDDVDLKISTTAFTGGAHANTTNKEVTISLIDGSLQHKKVYS